MPANAMTRPMSAAESSANTARSVGLEVLRMCSTVLVPRSLASLCAWRYDWRKETPSKTNDTASTPYAIA